MRPAKTMRHTRMSAFTLVELLVVIAIIALLLSVLMPALNKAREQARGVACLSNAKQIGLGVAIYKSEYRGSYCYSEPYKAGTLTYTDYLNEATWWHFIGPYINNSNNKSYNPKIIKCPSNPKWLFGYAFNVEFGYLEPDPANPPTVISAPMNLPLKEGQVKNPASKILITEGTLSYYECMIGWAGMYSEAASEDYSHRIYPAAKGRAGTANNDYYMIANYGYKQAYLHDDAASNVFADGHAARLTRLQMRVPEQWFPQPSREGNPWGVVRPKYPNVQ